MNNYRKKPVVIEAVQLTEKTVRKVYEFIYGPVEVNSFPESERWDDYVRIVIRDGLKLKTLESENQTQTADIGDWIVKGVIGEFYPCKPDVFAKTYEKA